MNIVNSNDCLLLIIDVQEKLVNMLEDKNIAQSAVKAAKAAGILNIPAVITEQYPKGLGATIEEIKTALKNAQYFEKTNFSALTEEGFSQLIKKYNKKQIIIFGIETHICVLQTAFDLINAGYEVFVLKDASGSRSEYNKESALNRLKQAGCQIITLEMLLFELLKGSKNQYFKEVQALIK